jgi:photosystem II stability/assembly factor-like uncharacterized protein
LNSAQFITRDLVTAIAIDPTDPGVWYAGTENAGIYKSIDGGISWLPVQNGLACAYVDTLIIDPEDPNTLYAGLNPCGIYKTTNGGQSWQAMNKNIDDIGWLRTSLIVMDPQNSQHLFYAQGYFLYESSDGARTWNEIEIPGMGREEEITDFAVNPTEPHNLYVSLDSGVVKKSTDGGDSWDSTILSYEGAGFTDIWIDRVSGENLFVSSNWDGTFYHSSDGGETWQKGAHRQCVRVVFHPEDSATAYCLGIDEGVQVYWTKNGGQDWQWLATVDRQTVEIGVILFMPQDPTVLLVGGKGVYLSKDEGSTWDSRSNGLGALNIELDFDPANDAKLYMHNGIAYENSSLYLSLDRGQTWDLITNEGEGLSFDADEQTLYRLWYSSEVIRSRDGGYSWTTITTKEGYFSNLVTHPTNPGTVYVVYSTTQSEPIFYMTSNGGKSWQKLDFNDFSAGNLFIGSPPDVVFYATGYGGPDGSVWYKSFNNGEEWQKCTWSPFGLSGPIIIDPQDPERIFLFHNGRVVLSDDGCNSWNYRDNGLDNGLINTLTLDPQNPNTMYAGTDNGAYISFDGGGSWHPINDGLLGGLVIYSIVVDEESNVYAATPLGIFELEQQ